MGNGDLVIETGDGSWETVPMSKDSSRRENCTLFNGDAVM